MRLSSSLQNLSTYSKVDPTNGEFDLELNGSSTQTKPIRVLQRRGTLASFSKEKSLPPVSSMLKKWKWLIVGFTAIVFVILLFFVCSSYSSSEYFVILDCGSTSTRVYVYEWSGAGRKGHTSLPIVLKSLPESFQKQFTARGGRAYQRIETEPGLGKLVHNETALRAAIKPLIEWAEKQIPKHAHKTTSLYLYATAGVRRLPSSDSEWLLDKAWSVLDNSSFLCQREWVKTISGMEEAYYEWIALNHHMGILGSSPAKETYGALDLGGSSLQVTFEMDKPVHGDTGLNLSIGAVRHHLSAYSLSGYGLNDAFDRSVAHLLKKLPGTTTSDLRSGKIELRHPCLHDGYREKYTCSECATLAEEGSIQNGGEAVGGRRPGVEINLVGVPQWEECTELAKTTVNLSEWAKLASGINCEFKPCALGDDLPRPRGRFYAMSGFFVVFRFFNLTSDAALDDVLQMGQTYCGKPWEVAKGSVAPQPFIEQYCFRAPYIVSLLRDGLHISEDQVIIGSGSITWTLGVALLEAGKMFSSRIELAGFKIQYKELDTTFPLILILLSVALLFCAISCATDVVPRYFRRMQLPLFRHNSATFSGRNVLSLFSFPRRSPTKPGDGRAKMPLSPTVASSELYPFHTGYGIRDSGVQLVESSLHPFGVSHSYSSGSLGQIQSASGNGSWTPLRGQTLQSRRSPSREDLVSSLTEAKIYGM